MQNVVGENIKKYRQLKSLTQAQLAAACGGRSVNQLNAYECGRSRPSPALMQIIAQALGVSPNDLAADSETRAKPFEARPDAASLTMALRELIARANGLSPDKVRVRIELNL